jgi:hypothetical protein
MTKLEEIPDRYKCVFACSECKAYWSWSSKPGQMKRVTTVEKKLKWNGNRKLHLVAAA